MLTKVTNRVRRRSLSQESTVAYHIKVVAVAPDLLRWSDFTNPFPQVATGGYTRYYASKTQSDAAGAGPTYCPELTRYPDFASSSASSSSKLPSPSVTTPLPTKNLLFSVPRADALEPSTPPKRSLAIIHEASRESMSPESARVTGQTSLRRRRRQLLRTPSIERDFAVNSRHLFSSSTSSLSPTMTGDVSASVSPYTMHMRSLSTSSADSSSLHHSDESHRTTSEESVQSEAYPITPTIGVDSSDARNGYGAILELGDTGEFEFRVEDADSSVPSFPTLEVEPKAPRPESWSSFSTAKSGFGAD